MFPKTARQYNCLNKEQQDKENHYHDRWAWQVTVPYCVRISGLNEIVNDTEFSIFLGNETVVSLAPCIDIIFLIVLPRFLGFYLPISPIKIGAVIVVNAVAAPFRKNLFCNLVGFF